MDVSEEVKAERRKMQKEAQQKVAEKMAADKANRLKELERAMQAACSLLLGSLLQHRGLL